MRKLITLIHLSNSEFSIVKKTETNYYDTIVMGKFQNFELSAEQRRLQQLKHDQRLALRAQFWKNMTDPHRHGSGEGGALVSSNFHNLTQVCVMSSNQIEEFCFPFLNFCCLFSLNFIINCF